MLFPLKRYYSVRSLFTTVNTTMQDYEVIKDKAEITITSETVRFRASVYQTKNISNFEFGTYRLPPIVPYWVLVLGLIIGAFVNDFTSQGLGGLIVLIVLGGLVGNLSQLRKEGFRLDLNSGKFKIFACKNLKQGKQVVDTIYNYIESGQKGSLVIQITDATIQGNVIGGNIIGDSSYGSLPN
jgi:hypothetical protein